MARELPVAPLATDRPSLRLLVTPAIPADVVAAAKRLHPAAAHLLERDGDDPAGAERPRLTVVPPVAS